VTKTCQKKIHWSYALIQDPPSPRVCSVLFLNSDRSRRDATSPLLQGAPVRLLHPVAYEGAPPLDQWYGVSHSTAIYMYMLRAYSSYLC
jgi:hypothetical protein